MTPLIPALGGALLVAGLIGAGMGMRPTPVQRTGSRPVRRTMPARLARMSQRNRSLLVVGAVAGTLVAVFTGWVIAIALVPAALVGIPVLLSAPPSAARVDRLEAMEEWTRSLAGVLTVGIGLEEALIATLRSTPDAIRPEVTQLCTRLRGQWSTEAALRAFADDLNDTTGDLIAMNLILSSRRRGGGLATILHALAASVAEDVRARRAVEADRAKPRATARWVTIITIGFLGALTLTGEYVAPYGTPLGQILLASYITAYVATLIWGRRMAAGEALPRILGQHRQGVTA